MHEIMQRYPFATLVTIGAEGLPCASHVAMTLDPEPLPYGRLRCLLPHTADAWIAARGHAQALVLFLGPQSYVTPSWYPTKYETGKVVPTWNYIAVHAYGALHAVDDEATPSDTIDVEIVIDRLLGKWKLSQDEPDVDRHGAIAGLRNANR